MKLARLLLAAAFIAALVAPLAAPAYADGGPGSDPLHDPGVDQHPNAQVPLDLMFVDETGLPVRLSDYFHGKPVLLTLNYYNCPNLCPDELNSLDSTLTGLKEFSIGKDYDVVTVSIDPKDTPADAASKKSFYVFRYARPGADTGWHFLTGDQDQISALANAIGFRYAYDPQSEEYAHPLAIVALTPDGRISRYLYGMDYAVLDLRLALFEAGQGKIGSLVDQALLICYHYNAAEGTYSVLGLTVIRIGGALTVGAVAAFLFIMFRRDLRRDRETIAAQEKK